MFESKLKVLHERKTNGNEIDREKEKEKSKFIRREQKSGRKSSKISSFLFTFLRFPNTLV